MNTSAFASLPDAYASLLALLDERLPFDLWAVTRVSGEDWILLDARDHSYGVKPGTRFPWRDMLCSRMECGEGPNYAPSVEDVPAYRDAPVRQSVPVGAYLGLPIRLSDGSLFGTLCAVSPAPHPRRELDLPTRRLLETVTRALGALIEVELKCETLARTAHAALDEAARDALTGLPNRRAWQQALAAGHRRVAGLGVETSVVMIDLDGLKEVNDRQGHDAGDRLLQRAAQAVTAVCRPGDLLARLGGDEFGLLLSDCAEADLPGVMARVREALRAQWIEASVGGCCARDATSLQEACTVADRRMYQDKRARKGLGGMMVAMDAEPDRPRDGLPAH